MEKNIRNGLVWVLVFLILCMFIVVYTNKDSLFKSTVEITYSDGCVEEYVNSELVSPMCIGGRKLANEEAESYVGEPLFNAVR